MPEDFIYQDVIYRVPDGMEKKDFFNKYVQSPKNVEVGKTGLTKDEEEIQKLHDTPEPEENFYTAYARTRGEEGDFSDTVGDKGGATQFGVSKRYWPQQHNELRQLVKQGKNWEAEQYARDFYRKNFWDTIGGSELSRKDAVVVFDSAVLMGPTRAKTLYKASGGDLKRYLDLRDQYHRSVVKKDPSQTKFLKGWLDRTKALRKSLDAGDFAPRKPFNPPEPPDNI